MEGFVTVDKGDLMEAVGMVTGHATVGMLLDDANNMARSLKHKGLMFALGSAIDSNDAAFIKAEKVLLDMLYGKNAVVPEPSKQECTSCKGTGTVSVPYTHPTNPNLDAWHSQLCGSCSGKGSTVSASKPRSEKKCFCGDPAYGDNGACGPSGCSNVPA